MFAVQKEQLKLTLALIDIDHFKSVNDRFGHLCGDEVILYVVDKINALNEQCSGWAARIGGDEFCRDFSFIKFTVDAGNPSRVFVENGGVLEG